jgi:16S rRNA (cytosine967-C5)-methyltransferase
MFENFSPFCKAKNGRFTVYFRARQLELERAQSEAVTKEITELAAQVIELAGGTRPADAVLREVLRSKRGPAQAVVAAEVSQTVFNYYRWHGWLDTSLPMEEQFRAAGELMERFRTSPETFSEDDLARAVPDWIWEEMDVTPAWLRALQMPPRLWLRAKRGQGKTLASKLGECWIRSDDRFVDAVEYQGHEDLFLTPEFHAGEFELQDIASQAVSLLCDPQPGSTWWDACAGEGGKTLHLSDLMQNKGLIWASDRADWRLKKLKRRTARAKCFNYRAALWDGGAKLPTKTKFDGVLVDAPCSGVGTWQRNPHARWTTSPKDVHELAAVQKQMLAHVAASVKPGGRLVYSVCTLTRAETTRVAEEFTQANPEFEALSLGTIGAGEHPNQRWIWPQDLDGNGMFVASWRRKPAAGAAT